ncbi:TonB-dependent siderophore receptor [Reyranella sp.]|uniref:TonB-dependent siderophore receptor n=1 Tax=Reyranella sp. TaxID=1929291 RepID=UPI003BA9849E
MGAASVRGVLWSVLAAMAVGQGGTAVAQQGAPELAQQQVTFDIPAQPLGDALASFGRQSGMQVSIDGGLARGVSSPGVSGTMTPEQALGRLLAGTGITYRMTGGNTALLQRLQGNEGGALQLDPLHVQGRVPPPTATIGTLPPAAPGGQVAIGGREGFLGNRDYMDTPYSGSAYTSTLMENQQARTIADVVANDPSATKYGLSMYDTFRMRGFILGGGAISFDGLYGLVPEDRVPVEAFERVEVFRGPSAFLNGFVGAVGGTINMVPKRATGTDVTSLAALYGTNAQFGARADVGRRFGSDRQVGARFSGLYRDGYTPLANNKERTGNAALSLDYAGENVRLAAHFGYTKQDSLAGNQLFIMTPNVPVPAAPNAFSAVQQPWETMNTQFYYGMGRGEVDLATDWTAYAAYGQSFFSEIWQRTLGTGLNQFGGFTSSGQEYSRTYAKQTGEAGVRGKMVTGPIQHSLAMVATGYWELVGSGFGALPFTLANNLYNPVFLNAPSFAAANPNPPKSAATTLLSFALSDTLSAFDDRVQLLLGARQQSIQNSNYAATGAQTSSYFASAVTPSVGLVAKPLKNVSLYGNYIEALQQGPVAPSTAVNAGQIFAPTRSWQIEAGAKVDLGQWSATLGLFQITQPAGITNTATNTFSVDGQQVNQGLELNVFGQPLDGFRILGGMMLLDPRLARTANGTFDGRMAPGTPNFTLKLGGEWDTPFAKGLTLAARVNYFSSQYVNEANTQSIPAYTLVGVGARYRFEVDRKALSIRANIENLFNESSWASAYTGGVLYRGSPRTFYLTLGADF